MQTILPIVSIILLIAIALVSVFMILYLLKYASDKIVSTILRFLLYFNSFFLVTLIPILFGTDPKYLVYVIPIIFLVCFILITLQRLLFPIIWNYIKKIYGGETKK